jgi:carbonic anhydrase/acetyltransferase-like protein (isoleucine patch superfamily)
VKEVINWKNLKDQTILLLTIRIVLNHSLAPTLKLSFNPIQRFPKIDKSSFISQFSSVIGDVTIKKNIYVAPNVSIRADEGTPLYIGSNTNIQDGVILHGLVGRRIQVGGKSYSVFIGKEVSVAHGTLIHGPCYIADNIFVGFNAIVYNAIVGKGSFISYNAVVTNGVQIPPIRFVPPGANKSGFFILLFYWINKKAFTFTSGHI